MVFRFLETSGESVKSVTLSIFNEFRALELPLRGVFAALLSLELDDSGGTELAVLVVVFSAAIVRTAA